VSAYKIAGTHRHTAEIEGTLAQLAGADFPVTFTPHLIPMTRGILATCYATLTRPTEQTDLVSLYREYYADKPFVQILEIALPATKHTLGSNRCHIGLAVDARMNRVTVVSVIDNLVKGMAGQAIQNMNLMCGFTETAGLDDIGGFWP
jgi:N-acetyl-gamma-glutamyl-phosphate reductase